MRRRLRANTSPRSPPGSSTGPGSKSSFERPTALVAGRLRGTGLGSSSAWPTRRSRKERQTASRKRLSVGRGWASRPSGRSAASGSPRRTSVGSTIGSDLPRQEFVFLGGPTSAPGYEFHELVGRFGASQRVEGRFSIPFVALSLGRYGNTGSRATLAPFAHVAYLARSIRRHRRAAEQGGRVVPVDRSGAADGVRPASIRCGERIT